VQQVNMIVKQTVTRHKYTINANELSKQIATAGGIELIAVIVTGGSGAAVVRVYDSSDGINQPSPQGSDGSFIVAANAGESTPFCPGAPIRMKRGLYIELEQPGGNGEATVFYNG